MVKILPFTLPFLVGVTLCCCSEYGTRQPPRNKTPIVSQSTKLPSTSRVYFQAYSLTKSGGNEHQHSHDNDGKNPSNVEVKKFPESIQAVNKSLEDAALKLSETRHLLGYEPETWNNRYTPPIPLDVLASETDGEEHDEGVDDDDGEGDNDNDESNDDEQTQETNRNNDDDGDDRESDDAPERDGEVTEEYNDENAQKVIDEIDGDIYGQEGNQRGDDFSFAATAQKPTIVMPNSDNADKQKRCKTVYREINGFTPSSKLLSDDDDFEFRWRRKRSLPLKEGPKPDVPSGTGQAQSSSYMITRECTFDDDDDEPGDELAEISDEHEKNIKVKNPEKKSLQGSGDVGAVEKPNSASSSSWSITFPKSVPSILSSSSLSSSPSVPSSPSFSSARRTTASRSESRFVPIFGWKKHPFIIHEETPAFFEPSVNNGFDQESNTFQAMNNDFTGENNGDYWLQTPNAIEQWNGWNHYPESTPAINAHNSAFEKPRSYPTHSEDSDGNVWNGNSDSELNSLAPPYQSYFQWRPVNTKKTMQKNSPKMAGKVKHGRYTHSDDGDDDEDGQHADEHSDDSGDDDSSNTEEETDSGMDHSPAEKDGRGGNVRRMFTQHVRKRRSVSSYSALLNNANFGWTQPAKAAQEQLQNDSPYTWNYFEQEHPNSNQESNDNDSDEHFERKPIHEDSEDSDGESQENDDESGDGSSDNGSADAGDGSESGNGHDPDNYSVSYDGGNDEEYNVDYDSDRVGDQGNNFNGGNAVSSADEDDDEYEKF